MVRRQRSIIRSTAGAIIPERKGPDMRLLFCVLILICIPGPFTKADDSVSLIRSFMGTWHSDGDAFGGPATSTMTWAQALDGLFARLDYRIDMQRDGDVSVFRGTAYYRLGPATSFPAFWADTSGDLHPITMVRDGTALVSTWGLDSGKQGRTRYDLIAPDTIEVTDWIKTRSDGTEGWKQFNRNIFVREHPKG